MNNCSRFRLVSAFLALAGALWGQVLVREDHLTLPTYDDGAPDPNPQFPQFFKDEFPNYPYPILQAENQIRHVTAWRTVVIENEYLSCRILPDLGGHLHGCTDKISGKEIFYANPVVRKIGAPRGDFLSTGIESSFPYAHSRVGSSPVDFAYSLTDGVGRVVVEDRDRVSGMMWRDEFILRPGSAVLEQTVTLSNTGTSRQPYHWWANAAVELDDPHMRIVYPVKWMLPHGDGPMMQWPVDHGVDLSDVANYKKAIGLFAHGSNEPWMAMYKPSLRSGVAHYADPRQVPGKKVWLWAEDNKYVLANLTEKFNSYVEMQAGTMETQPEFAFLQPGEVKRFTEYWIPFRDVSGVTRVTPDLVLNIKRAAGAAPGIELVATRHIPGAKIRVLDGTKAVFETTADLDPKANWTKPIDGAPAAMTVEVTDAAGAVLLHHVEGQINALPFDRNGRNPEPVEPPAAGPDPRTQTELMYLLRGLWHERHEQFLLARNDYRAGLGHYPGSEALRVAMGRVDFTLTRWNEVIPLLAGISHGPAQTEAAYYYGVVLAEASPLRFEARNALNNAVRNPAFAVAARYELALLNAREGNLAEAAKVMDQITMEPAAGSASDPRAPAQMGAAEVAILRRARQNDAAKKKLDYWLAKDPANNMLRVEKTLVSGADDASVWAHLAGNPDLVITLADDYAAMGDWQDAVALLDRKYPALAAANEAEPGTVLPQDYALVAYFRGYCRARMGQDPAADFALAAGQSVLDVFPHRARMYDVLDLAVEKNPNDANAHSLLGDLNFDSGDTDAAIAEWGKALALKKDIPALYRNLGRALLEVKRDIPAARQVLQEGARLHPEDNELRSVLANANSNSPVIETKYLEAPLTVAPANKEPAPKPTTAPKQTTAVPPPAPKTAPAVTSVPISPEVADRALLGSPVDAERAAQMFNAENFPKDRQPNEVRRDYIEVQLQRLLARAHAGKCREMADAIEMMGDENQSVPFTLYGFGAFMRPAHFQYYLGVVENLCGDDKAAKKRWSRIAKTSETFESVDDVFPYLALKSLDEKGWQQKIDAAIKTVHGKAGGGGSPELQFMEGALLMAAGKQAEGDALLQKAFYSKEPMAQFLGLVAMHENSIK